MGRPGVMPGFFISMRFVNFSMRPMTVGHSQIKSSILTSKAWAILNKVIAVGCLEFSQ